MSHCSNSSSFYKQIPHMNRYHQYNHAFQIDSHSSLRKQDLYPKATVRDTTEAIQQQHSDRIAKIPHSQSLHSLQIDPHPSVCQRAPLREYEHPQSIPSLYSPFTSPKDVAYFRHSPFGESQQLTPQFRPQHPSRIEPHPSVTLGQMYSPIPAAYNENIPLGRYHGASHNRMVCSNVSDLDTVRINLHPSIATHW